MKILVTGGHGQVGQALARLAPVTCKGHRELDICGPVSPESIDGFDAVINCAAMANVDQAENDPAGAFRANRDGPANLARACAARGARLLHISTDYVFDGRGDRPYREDDAIAPINVYGRSKAEGEAAVLAADPSALVVRTSWVFCGHGENFATALLRRARGGERVRVVADQRGCPTWADDLAAGLLALAAGAERGVLHYCGEPPVTRYEFACEIMRIAGVATRVEPAASAELADRAPRPRYSVLDTSRVRALGITPRPWRDGLERLT